MTTPHNQPEDDPNHTDPEDDATPPDEPPMDLHHDDYQGSDDKAESPQPDDTEDVSSHGTDSIEENEDYPPIFDLTEALQGWEHQQGQVNVRLIEAFDGRPILQLRVDLGILQMEVVGRPDGIKPEHCESWLDYFHQQLEVYLKNHDDDPGDFVISSEDCRNLREETVQYYHRYVSLYALDEFAGVINDADHNRRVFELCASFGETEFDRDSVAPLLFHAVMTIARAQASAATLAGDTSQAIEHIDSGIKEIRDMMDDDVMDEELDEMEEIKLLLAMRDALIPKLPVSLKSELKHRLRAAIEAEHYELAAILRDEMRLLED